jgi:hypothetical protein
MGSYEIDNSLLIAAIQELQRLETAAGRWGRGGTTLPFGDELQKLFPVIGRFLHEEGQPTISQLPPDLVAGTLKGALA